MPIEQRPNFSFNRGNNRHVRYWPDTYKRAVMSQKDWEIQAWARDRQIDPGVIRDVAEQSLRLGRIPEMGNYGLSYDDSEALAHFISDVFLNIESEECDNDWIEEGMRGVHRFGDVPAEYYRVLKAKGDALFSAVNLFLGAYETARRAGEKAVEVGSGYDKIKRDRVVLLSKYNLVKYVNGGRAVVPVDTRVMHRIITAPHAWLQQMGESTANDHLPKAHEIPVKEMTNSQLEDNYIEQFNRLVYGTKDRPKNRLFDPSKLPNLPQDGRDFMGMKTPTGCRLRIEMETMHGDKPIKCESHDDILRINSLVEDIRLGKSMRDSWRRG